MELKVKNLCVHYGKREVLAPLSTTFTNGITCILGENGSGKTTLLKTIYLQTNSTGELFFNNQKVDRPIALEKMSYLPQEHPTNISLSVLETILLGDYSKLGLRVSSAIKDRALNLLEDFGIFDLQGKEISKISGGQRKLVFLAQALLKQPKILLLDEPCNFLDIHNQILFFDIISNLKNIIVIAAMHEVNLSLRYCDRFILLKNGVEIWTGASDELNASTINNTFNVESSEYTINNVKQFFFKI